MCLFTQVFEPLLQRRMFSVVDIVHFTCPNVNVTRVQKRPTDVPSAKCRIGTELVNTSALRLPKTLLRKIDEFLVGYTK